MVRAAGVWIGFCLALGSSATGQVSVRVTPWVRAAPTTVPGASGFQADAALTAHNAGVVTERVSFTLTSLDGPFIQAPAILETVLEPGELAVLHTGVFSAAAVGGSESVQHIVLVQPTVQSSGDLPGLGVRARPSTRFTVEPLAPVVDARGLPASPTSIDLRVTNLSDATNPTRTLAFAVSGPVVAPATMPVTLGVGESAVVTVPITPTPGTGDAGVEFADLVVLYADDPASPAGAVQHASAIFVFGPADAQPDLCPTDLNNDGATNAGDIAVILNLFGQACP